MKKIKIIVVLGPTASGKSKVALELAKKFNGFLISADSRQVYREMDIGTNKDPLTEKNGKYFFDGIEEFLVNVVAPDENSTLDDWLGSARKQISEVGQMKLPIIVGGTGLYVSALIDNYDLRGGFDEKLRIKFEKMIEEKGIAAVLEEIKKIDPKIENKIDAKNPRRVARAAEICFATGKPFERMKKEIDSEFEFLQIGVGAPREKLYEKINQRVDRMIESGLIEEVKKLMAGGYSCDLPSMTGIGYWQVCDYLNGKYSLEQAIELIKRDTRRYAKRQMTWFRRDERIHWVKNEEQAEEIALEFLK
ncbi:tRNA (adenosine(37)-N6)-dimethylallyltransferase MiaA [Patescibacteria group bacterium]|nr:tRNA (adenosine(37)-N6)-dimethylallyltransferase MiaA [Patescibacteria group bacterium]